MNAQRSTGAGNARLFRITGAVQGTGFRPFVYRLAVACGLRGRVRNDGQGVCVEVAGASAADLDGFAGRLRLEAPPAARIESITSAVLPAATRLPAGFEIAPSAADDGPNTAILTADLATCAECRAELADPGNRRYRYPFINCTQCGPRFSIIKGLPYDRPRTTMAGFRLCEACRLEYETPADRRFHAQPNACPVCGPRLTWTTGADRGGHHAEEALRQALSLLRAGGIVALKGLGGFQLLADPANAETMRRLRSRKRRPDKPFALMYPSLGRLQEDCRLSKAEVSAVESVAAPIVLLRRLREAPDVCDLVHPATTLTGAMLPYTPLHHLLLADFGRPLVATSGNRADEPISTDNDEACDRLGGIADGFLMHDRPIARPLDDSVVRIADGALRILRLARGYAPLVWPLPAADRPAAEATETVLAVGGHIKNAVALIHADRLILGPHTGDVASPLGQTAFVNSVRDLGALHHAAPTLVACDTHPDYPSSRHARGMGLPLLAVQHHRAHVAGAMLEHGLTGPVLGVAWDGTGLGDDGTIWGGEWFLGPLERLVRVARLRPFPLPGGETAMRDPRRCAFAMLHAIIGPDIVNHTDLAPVAAFSAMERRHLLALLSATGLAPTCSSVGRLFDAVAGLLGLCGPATFEGQAAMALENACTGDDAVPYAMPIGPGADASVLDVDWRPGLRAMLSGLRNGDSVALIATRFHAMLCDVVRRVAGLFGCPRVVLTGGCFQNERLLHGCRTRLNHDGVTVYGAAMIPAGDGGLAAGQAFAAWSLRNRKETERVPGHPG